MSYRKSEGKSIDSLEKEIYRLERENESLKRRKARGQYAKKLLLKVADFFWSEGGIAVGFFTIPLIILAFTVNGCLERRDIITQQAVEWSQKTIDYPVSVDCKFFDEFAHKGDCEASASTVDRRILFTCHIDRGCSIDRIVGSGVTYTDYLVIDPTTGKVKEGPVEPSKNKDSK